MLFALFTNWSPTVRENKSGLVIKSVKRHSVKMSFMFVSSSAKSFLLQMEFQLTWTFAWFDGLMQQSPD